MDRADILLLIAAVTLTVVLVVSYDFSVPMCNTWTGHGYVPSLAPGTWRSLDVGRAAS